MATYENIKCAEPGVMIVRKSVDAECAETRFCFNVASGTSSKIRFCDSNNLYVDSDDRVFTIVEVGGKRMYMQALTGSLYDMATGRCLTSDNLFMTDVGIKRNQKRGKKILLSKRTAWMN